MPARLLIALAMLVTSAGTAAQDAEAPAPAAIVLDEDQRVAAFTAAGFVFEDGAWRACGDPGMASYVPGSIDTVADLNGDGLPDAVISEGSSFCFGMTASGYALVSTQADGSWKKLDGGQGIPLFLETRGVGDWPDLMIGGPGFCFPVLRWNGERYIQHRFEYEGKPCVP